MVQNVGVGASYGAINKVGTTQDGRIVYQVTDPNGKYAGALSVAQIDSDKFEHSYETLMNAAPKLEKYMQTHTEDDIKKSQKKGRWITAIGAFTGGIIPAVALKKPNTFIKILCTIAGTVVGLIGGAKIAQKIVIPPGAEEMSRASQEISKMDIQPM